jgi:hypothetical protein
MPFLRRSRCRLRCGRRFDHGKRPRRTLSQRNELAAGGAFVFAKIFANTIQVFVVPGGKRPTQRADLFGYGINAYCPAVVSLVGAASA